MNVCEVKNCTIGAAGENAVFVANILASELKSRTGLEFDVGSEGAINIREDSVKAPAPEGYVLKSAGGEAELVGYDKLGCLFAAGRLLKECRWKKGSLELPDMDISTFPKKSIRGSQIGYRNKTNAYSAWSLDTYRRYILDLALFGANSVEFLPGKTDDADTAPCMKYNSQEVLVATSEYAHSLGLNVWIWYPNSFDNESGIPIPASGFVEETSEAAKKLNADLREADALRERDFSEIPYIDNILIPGGDPGSLEPEDLFAFSERVARILHKYHPNAGVWISAQVMKNDESFKLRFYDQVVRRPDWLRGVCHAPWVSHVMKECRERTPLDLPLRSYPDICHALCCQYPYHQMDPIWAVTAGREFYNPRPRWHRRMQQLNAQYNLGCLAYSEGIADDVSKMIWLDGDWDEKIPYTKTLRDFASMFISPEYAVELASVIAQFEDIFEGPAVKNNAVRQVYTYIRQLKAKLEKEEYMPGFGADSYRLSMPMLMSAFCLQVQKRALRDSAVMEKALGEIHLGGTSTEIAERMLADLEEVACPPDKALYDEVWALADECWEKIQWKLSERRHSSPDYQRGGFVETVDLPLCDSEWLRARLSALDGISGEEERMEYIRSLCFRTDAGPGGKYINFGEPDSMRYLELDKTWWDEPEAITVPRIEQCVGMWGPDELGKKNADKVLLSRVSSVLGYYDAKVRLSIDGLVPGAAYELRIVFPLRFGWKGQKEIPAFILCRGERLVCRGPLAGDEWVYVYDVPEGAVDENGVLKLVIDKETGPRGSGATEIWLIKKTAESAH